MNITNALPNTQTLTQGGSGSFRKFYSSDKINSLYNKSAQEINISLSGQYKFGDFGFRHMTLFGDFIHNETEVSNSITFQNK